MPKESMRSCGNCKQMPNIGENVCRHYFDMVIPTLKNEF